jgi:hypothetical protein
MASHLLGVLEPSIVFQVNRDAGRTPGVTSDWGEKARCLGPLASSEHVERIQYSLHSSLKRTPLAFCAALMMIVQRVV